MANFPRFRGAPSSNEDSETIEGTGDAGQSSSVDAGKSRLRGKEKFVPQEDAALRLTWSVVGIKGTGGMVFFVTMKLEKHGYERMQEIINY